ncbi:hypothetical protein L195_g062176, partial [Trifolium pratense]
VRSQPAFERQQQILDDDRRRKVDDDRRRQFNDDRRRKVMEEDRRRESHGNHNEGMRINKDNSMDGKGSKFVGGGELIADHKLDNGNKHGGVVSKHVEVNGLGTD